MARAVVKTITGLYGYSELAGDLSKVTLKMSGEPEDVTNLAGDGWREFLLGLKGAELMLEGFLGMDANQEPESFLLSHVTSDGSVVVTLDKERPRAAGDLCYFGQFKAFTHDRPFEVGKVMRFSQSLKSDAPLIRGKVLETVTRTSTGNSAALDLGVAVATGERLYYAIHVERTVDGTSPTLDLLLRSDTVGFPTPTTRVTVPQITTHGTVFGYVDGPITDTYWRVDATVGGSGGPSFPYTVVLGIVPATF